MLVVFQIKRQTEGHQKDLMRTQCESVPLLGLLVLLLPPMMIKSF